MLVSVHPDRVNRGLEKGWDTSDLETLQGLIGDLKNSSLNSQLEKITEYMSMREEVSALEAEWQHQLQEWEEDWDLLPGEIILWDHACMEFLSQWDTENPLSLSPKRKKRNSHSFNDDDQNMDFNKDILLF